MKPIQSSNVAIIAWALLLVTAAAAPMQEAEEEQSVNLLPHGEGGEGGDGDETGGWDAVDTAVLRKLLMQLDTVDRLDFGSRVGRAWPQAEPRGWGLRTLRSMDGRLARQWRADKRQVRFRQCYFNPISCFRK